MLTTFDSPQFNTTCTMRVRSNTPLQSLTMANDQAMLEHVRALGCRLLEFSSDDQAKIEHAYQLCFARMPDPHEHETLLQFVIAQRGDFKASPADAKAFAGAADSEPESSVELAVWTAVARVLLNLDEFITRE
jgi:hypothetical protein